MNQREFANIVGITESAISYILNGSRNAGKFLAKELAKITNSDAEIWRTGTPAERMAAFRRYAETEGD